MNATRLKKFCEIIENLMVMIYLRFYILATLILGFKYKAEFKNCLKNIERLFRKFTKESVWSRPLAKRNLGSSERSLDLSKISIGLSKQSLDISKRNLGRSEQTSF